MLLTSEATRRQRAGMLPIFMYYASIHLSIHDIYMTPGIRFGSGLWSRGCYKPLRRGTLQRSPTKPPPVYDWHCSGDVTSHGPLCARRCS